MKDGTAAGRTQDYAFVGMLIALMLMSLAGCDPGMTVRNSTRRLSLKAQRGARLPRFRLTLRPRRY